MRLQDEACVANEGGGACEIAGVHTSCLSPPHSHFLEHSWDLFFLLNYLSPKRKRGLYMNKWKKVDVCKKGEGETKGPSGNNLLFSRAEMKF